MDMLYTESCWWLNSREVPFGCMKPCSYATTEQDYCSHQAVLGFQPFSHPSLVTFRATGILETECCQAILTFCLVVSSYKLKKNESCFGIVGIVMAGPHFCFTTLHKHGTMKHSSPFTCVFNHFVLSSCMMNIRSGNRTQLEVTHPAFLVSKPNKWFKLQNLQGCIWNCPKSSGSAPDAYICLNKRKTMS